MGLGKQIGPRQLPNLDKGSRASAERQAAEFFLDIEDVLPETFAIDAARRDFPQDTVDDLRKSAHEGRAGMAVGQHQGKIVAHTRQVPESAEKGRP